MGAGEAFRAPSVGIDGGTQDPKVRLGLGTIVEPEDSLHRAGKTGDRQDDYLHIHGSKVIVLSVTCFLCHLSPVTCFLCHLFSRVNAQQRAFLFRQCC
jgi:hypothetical protein